MVSCLQPVIGVDTGGTGMIELTHRAYRGLERPRRPQGTFCPTTCVACCFLVVKATCTGRSGADKIVPDTYFQAADASIAALAIGRVPPKDGQNRFIYDADPSLLAYTSFDLSTRVVDLRDPQVLHEIGRTRCTSNIARSLDITYAQHTRTETS
jgi:hypothetical protein